MKKTLKFVSMLLIIAMALSFFTSCGMKPEERFAKAMEKSASATKIHSVANVDMDMSISLAGQTQDTSVSSKIDFRGDFTDEGDPLISILTKATVGGTTTQTDTYYKDGYMYTRTGDNMIKVKMSFDEMMNGEAGTTDFTDLFAYAKETPDSVTITENENGTLTVELPLTNEEHGELINELMGNELKDSFGESTKVSFEDTVAVMTIDKNNEITSMKMDLKMKLSYRISNRTARINITYKFDIEYRHISDDFSVYTPSPADNYKEP